MATSSGGYLPLSTVPDRHDQDNQDTSGPGSGNIILQELRSYFLNRREFPALYPAASIILLLGDTGLDRFSLVEEVCNEIGIVCFHVCSPPGSYGSYSGGQEAMLEFFLEQAEELSAEKEVVLYFDEAEIGLIGKIRDIPTKTSLVGAASSSESLDSALLSKVSKHINFPPPDLTERLTFLKQKINEAHFINKIGEKELEFIGQETENYSFRDLQKLWYQRCDILLSQLRNAGQVKNKAEQMKMTGDVMVRALFAVNNSGHHKTMGEEDYLKKFSDFVDKKEDLSIDVDETNKYTTRNWRPNSEERTTERVWERMLMRKHEWESNTEKSSDRSWYRLYVVLKGPHLHFYSDQVAYKTGLHKEQPLYLQGGTADNAPDYDKKKHVFRISLANGGSYLFQAEDDEEVRYLVNKINQQAQLQGELPAKSLQEKPLPVTDPVEIQRVKEEDTCISICVCGIGIVGVISFFAGLIYMLTLERPKWN